MSDTLTLDAPRRTADGYLAVRARAARTGVYAYTGAEVDPDNAHGLRDQSSVNVLRDDAAVFDERAVHSFLMKPITDDHPAEAVTSRNWKDHARGVVAKALRDGDHLAFDLVLMDAEAIAKVDAGKAELSNGYSAKLEFGDFAAPDGTKCPVRQSQITGNHIAIVDRGRAGPSCRIGDTALCDALPANLLPRFNDGVQPVKTMIIDGLTVDVSNPDTAVATINTLIAARDTATGKVAGLQAEVATLKTESVTKDAKVTTLEQALKDAKPTPQQLRDAGKALMITAGKAKALGVAVTDAMDEPTIMAATVTAKMGDTAKDWNEAQIAASFAVLTKDAKVIETGVHPIAAPAIIADAAARETAAMTKANDHNAWRTAAAA